MIRIVYMVTTGFFAQLYSIFGFYPFYGIALNTSNIYFCPEIMKNHTHIISHNNPEPVFLKKKDKCCEKFKKKKKKACKNCPNNWC
jgi:hypothetical protein|tara:strand:- start:128 stop:385 length:258 start_codon:yes stop_codon:yes gene_type:complete